MAKFIRTIIDGQGNITSDLSGFAGDECIAEEERFRGDLAQFGLLLSLRERQRKVTENVIGAPVSHRVL